jgi:hypothetical protein
MTCGWTASCAGSRSLSPMRIPCYVGLFLDARPEREDGTLTARMIVISLLERATQTLQHADTDVLTWRARRAVAGKRVRLVDERLRAVSAGGNPERCRVGAAIDIDGEWTEIRSRKRRFPALSFGIRRPPNQGARDVVVTKLGQQRDDVDAVETKRPASFRIEPLPGGAIVPVMMSEEGPVER